MENNNGQIDKDVLDILNHQDILGSVSSDKETKRLILNCFCEFLSQIKELKNSITEFNQLISVVSADKLTEYFVEVKKNFETEKTKANVQEKISKGHKKPTKSIKTNKKV